ncbi:MAG: TonB-dependent receptor [Microscillaceae bacterium]
MAQTPSDCHFIIQGFVQDARHQPLPGVSVYIPSLKRGLVSDEQGAYRFEHLCPGRYVLVFQYVGYQTKSMEIEACQSDEAPHTDLTLADDAIHLEEITISEKALSASDLQLQKTQVLQGVDLARQQGKNLGQILQNLPGVSVLQTGAGIAKPVIQGLHSQRIMILNNGIRLEGQQWGVEHAPEIDPFLAQDITVIKGSATVEYGVDALAGAILVNPPPLPEAGQWQGKMFLSGQSNNWGGAIAGSLAHRLAQIPGLGFRIQGSGRYAGDTQAPDYVLSNTGLREHSFSTELAYKQENWGASVFFSQFNTEIGILAAAHIGNTTDLFRAIESGQPAIVRDFTYTIGNPRQQVAHNLLKTAAFWKISPQTRLDFQYGLQNNQRDEFDIRRGGRSERPAIRIRLLTQTADLSLRLAHHTHWQGKFGLQGFWQDNFNDVTATGTARLIPDFDRYGASVFALERFSKGRWEWEGGIRYDFVFLRSYLFDEEDALIRDERRFHNYSLSTGGAFRPNENWILRAHLGYARRNPWVNELYSEGLHHGAAAIEEGNPALKPEGSLKLALSAEWQNDTWQLLLNPYWHHFQDFIFMEAREIRLTIRGAFPVFAYTQSAADFVGLDATLRYKPLPSISIQTDMAYLHSTSGLLWINPSRFKHSFRFTPSGKGKFFRELYAGLALVQVLRQRFAPEAVEDVANIPANPQNAFDFAAAPPGYVLLNLEAGFQIPFKKQALRLGLEIENMLNTNYRDYLNRYRYFADDVGRNFNLRLQYLFDSHFSH